MESTEGRKDLVFITKVYEVKLMSWFSKEDLDMIIKTYEATSNTSFRALFTIYNFALFLIDKYEAHFDTEPGFRLN